MKQYSKLAGIYDYLVQGIDYEDWYKYIKEICHRFAVQVEVAVDLACGTGNTTLPFARDGVKIYGLDLAEAMLAKAEEKARREQLPISFLLQDMRRMEIGEQVDLVTCYHDGLNYITSIEDLVKVFKGVNKTLLPGGLFIFDMNAVSKLAGGVTNDTTFLDEENMSLIWETNYNREEDLWEICLTGFVRVGEFYDKFCEVHQEKSYSRGEVLHALERADLKLLAEYHGFSFEEPMASSRRIFYVARKDNQ